MSTKVLVLGIDAASPELLVSWAAAGKLPAIAALLERGLSGPIRGLDGLFIGSTWPSWYTGLNPARHGFYRIVQLKPGTYDFYSPLHERGAVGGSPFWKTASDAGRRVAVLDVPLTRADPHLNGLQVVEWGGHDAVFGLCASSARTKRDVLATVGPYPLPTNCDAVRTSAEDFEPFLRGLETAARRKAQLTIDVLGRAEWDLLVQVFTEAHCAGHQAWHLHDPTHPGHDAELRRRVGDPLERVYRAVDAAIAEILAHAGDAAVLLFAAHGMGSYRGAQFLLPEILFRLGVTTRAATAGAVEGRATAVARRAWRRLPTALRTAVRPLRARSTRRPAAAGQLLGADPRLSRCFPVQNGSPVGAIRLNLAGREPAGVLERGAQTDAFCAALERDLREIVDERTGRPLIASVRRTRDLYVGARIDGLPDLLVEWSAEPATGSAAIAAACGASVRATSAKIGTIEGTNRYTRTGEHLPTGMFVAAGPRIGARGRRDAVSLLDFHPTICAMLGVAPLDVDGAAIPEIAAAWRMKPS